MPDVIFCRTARERFRESVLKDSSDQCTKCRLHPSWCERHKCHAVTRKDNLKLLCRCNRDFNGSVRKVCIRVDHELRRRREVSQGGYVYNHCARRTRTVVIAR